MIVQIVQFWKKKVYAQKYWLKSYSNEINDEPVYFRERLTKRDRDLKDYMDGLGLVTSTNNCAPQVMVKTANGSRKHNIVSKQDADELLAIRKTVVKNKS